MATHLELDLEERLSLFLGGRGRADGRCQEGRALALLLSGPGLLGASSLGAGLFFLACSFLGFAFFSALEHGCLLGVIR
jgi:hypothetical protein